MGLVLTIVGASRPASASLRTGSAGPAADSLRHLAPGARWTLAVPLSNPSARARTFRIAVDVPSGWSIAGAQASVTIPPRGRDLAFISLSVGRAVAAGEGVVCYVVRIDDDSVRRDSVRYLIAERRDLTVLGTAPAFAATGASYLATFVVTNRGNTSRAFDVQVVSDVPTTLDGPVSRTVTAGGVDTIVIKARVPSAAPAGGSSAVTVRLRPTVDSSMEHLVAFVQTTIFTTGGGDTWVRLPLHITPSIAGRDGGLAVDGRGPLGHGNMQADLALRGPRRPASIAGAEDEYRLALTSPTWQLRLGDQALHLTPLTEDGRVASGASVAYTGPILSAGVGDVMTRQFGEATHLAARFGTLGVHLPFFFRLQGTALVRSGRADSGAVGGLQLAWSPSSRHVVEVEGDRARNGGLAWRAKAGTSIRRVRLSAAVLDADTLFPGYTRGTRSVDADGRLQLSSQLWVRASGQDRSTTGGLLFGRDIANPDTLLAHEPLAEHRYRNASFVLGVSRAFQLEARWRRRDELLGTVAVWGDERIVALSSTIGPRLLQLSPHIEVGAATSPLYATAAPLRRASLDLRIALGRWGSFSPSAGLDLGRSMYDTTERRSWSAGTQLEVHSAHTRALVEGQYGLTLVAGPWTPPAPSRRVDVSIVHELSTGDELQALLRWDPQARRLAGGNTRVELAYRLRLGVPIGRPQTTGWVRGRVQADEDGAGMSGVMVRLDDRLAMTGERGDFQFSGVPAGLHVLDVDNRTLGDGRLIRDSAFRAIQVVDGRESRVSLLAARGGRISGRVRWYDRAPSELLQPADSLAGGAAMVLRDSAPGLSILLRSRTRTVQVTTDAAGQFSRDGLEPAEWDIMVEASDVPATHRVQSPDVKVIVPAAGSANVELQLVPRLRTVHLLTSPSRPSPAAAPERVPRAVAQPIRRREVPLRPALRGRKPVVRDVPLVRDSTTTKCPWPVVRPNGPICQEPASPDSIAAVRP